VLLAAFSDYCSLSFFGGSLLKDPEGILVWPGENSRIARLAKFTNLKEIKSRRTTLASYIKEAVEMQERGLKPAPVATLKLELPEELEAAFKTDRQLKKAFLSLTPGRQRGYVIYFAQAKQAATRSARIEKCKSKIKAGLGLHDR
jgi:uncharacterized protein YdeI (YjbR/CyaY-like superfamily)